MSCAKSRDRLGFWGDSEINAAVSGMERLRIARFNKVIIFVVLIYILNEI